MIYILAYMIEVRRRIDMLKIIIIINLILQTYLTIEIKRKFNVLNIITIFSIIMSIILIFKI